MVIRLSEKEKYRKRRIAFYILLPTIFVIELLPLIILLLEEDQFWMYATFVPCITAWLGLTVWESWIEERTGGMGGAFDP